MAASEKGLLETQVLSFGPADLLLSPHWSVPLLTDFETSKQRKALLCS
jgi:hypothetical protein